MVNYPHRCSIQEQHFGLTWGDSHLCSIHREPNPKDLSQITSLAMANKMYAEFEEVFKPNVKAESPAVANQIIQAAIENITSDAAAAAAARSIITVDVPDMNERYSLAWNMRENIAAALFPYVCDKKEEAIAALTEKVDKYGRSTESNRLLISYLVTFYWFYNANLGVTVSGVPNVAFSDSQAYVEFLGNYGSEHSVFPAVGKVLYLHESFTKEAFGYPPKNLAPHHPSLVVVPDAYKTSEAAKHANQLAADKARIIKKVRGGAGLLGILITNSIEDSQRKDAKKRKEQDDANRSDRQYATRLWLEREEEARRRRNK